jgi:hypothetical protein
VKNELFIKSGGPSIYAKKSVFPFMWGKKGVQEERRN